MAKIAQDLGGENSIRVNLPVESDVYQAYLQSLKERERLREENGGDTFEGLEAVRKSVETVNRQALNQYRRERSG